MSVIIRLQNLPWSANALDIRQYFHGLSIPEGGVHIVGGEKGDAFIAFSTDEDARQAFNRSNGRIKDSQISLMLSSRTEMQKIIEAARTQSMAAFLPPVVPPTTSSLTDLNNVGDNRRRSRSRSRSRSREGYDRNGRRRDRSRSSSRERNRDRRRRTRSRSRERSKSRERKNGNKHPKNAAPTQPHRVDVWESPPQTLLNGPANPANLLANFVANNLLPTILNGNANLSQVAGANLQQQLQASNGPLLPQNQAHLNGFNPNSIRTHRNNMHDDRNRSDVKHNCVENNCIKLYPFFGGVVDIIRFFSNANLNEDSIVHSKDIFGNRNGQIYINFAYPEYRDDALSLSGGRIRNQIITIEPVSDLEFSTHYLLNANHEDNMNQGADGPMSNNRLNNRNAFTHLKIVVLPNFANAQDVRNIFRNYPVSSVVLEPKGRIQAAYIKFNQAIDADDAFNNTNIHRFEGKPIEVSVCYDEEFEEMARRFGTDTMQVPTNIVAMTGLPPKCTERDIIDFFSDIGVMPSKINLIPDESGFVNEAICTFYNVEDAIVGFQKNGTLFGNNTVCMKYEPINEVAAGSASGPMPLMDHPHNRPMLPPLMNNMPHQQHQGGSGGNGNRPFFHHPNNHFGGPPMRGGPRPNMPMQMNNPMGGGGGGMQMNRYPPHDYDCDDDIGDDDALAPPGCVLLMENVPYKAGVDEILNFFRSFNIPCENVLRKYNSNGMPTGEAKVIFNNPEEVYHAIQENRGRCIRDRHIKMTQI